MSKSIRLEPGQLGVALRAGGKKHKEAIDRGTRLAAYRSMAHLKTVSPVGVHAALKNGWHVVHLLGGYSVRNSAPYAGIVERGARPHPVSKAGIESITEWAAKVLGVDEKEARSVAYAIAHRIREEGQEPTWFVKNEMPRMIEFLRLEILSSIERALNGQ